MISHGEILEDAIDSNPFFILSIVYILVKFCRNIVGFEILDFHLFYRPLIKEINGLP